MPPVSSQFVRAISGQGKVRTGSILDIDFPTLDELEMDCPILNAHMAQMRVSPEDDENLEMQYMLHFDPCLSRTGDKV